MAEKSVQVKKQCCRCKEWKDKREFHKDKNHRDGLNKQCRECVCESVRKRYAKGKGILMRYLRYEETHKVVDGVRKKLCKKCNEWKDESSFYKYIKKKDGLSLNCKECSNKATNKSRRRRAAKRAVSLQADAGS